MQLEDYFDFNTEPVEHIRIKGTRIDIDHVIELYKRHMTPEQIAAEYLQSLTLLQVYATITYYHQNASEVESYLTRGDENFKRREASYWASLSPEQREQQAALRTRIKDLKARFTDENGRLDLAALRAYRVNQRRQPTGAGV